MECILCKSNKLTELETIESAEIIRLSRFFLKKDISYLFKGVKNIHYYACSTCDLKFFSPPVIGDEQYYSYLQKHDWYYMDEKQEFAYASKFVKNSFKVLEIGSGKGAFTKYIGEADYKGLDFSLTAKKMAAKAGIKIENESIYSHAEKNKMVYDFICAFQTLEHVNEPNYFIESALECLKSGGFFVISVPSEESFIKLAVNAALLIPPHHLTRWSDKALHSVGGLFGLKCVGLYHEGLADIHKQWYTSVFIASRLRDIFRLKNKIIDLKFLSLFIHVVSSKCSKFLADRQRRKGKPIGHSVVGVFKKS